VQGNDQFHHAVQDFLVLGSLLVVGCHTERLTESIHRLESVGTIHTLNNGKEDSAPHAETWLRRLQRHEVSPVKPNDVPIAAVLSDFTVVVTSDDANAIDEAQLTTTLQDYLMAGMRDVYCNVEAVRLQPQHLPQRRNCSRLAMLSSEARRRRPSRMCNHWEKPPTASITQTTKTTSNRLSTRQTIHQGGQSSSNEPQRC
jgi:hypothetical protein